MMTAAGARTHRGPHAIVQSVNTTDGSVALHHEVTGPEDGQVVLLGSSLGTTTRMWDGHRLAA